MEPDPADWDPTEHEDPAQREAQLNEVREKCPVARTNALGGVWSVLRYDDIAKVTRQPELFSNAGTPRYGRGLPPLEVDPPEHGRFRRLLQHFFLPKQIGSMEPRLREIARSLVTDMLQSDEPDLARDFAYPLPVISLCVLLGVDGERWDDIKRWSEDSLLFDSPEMEERKRAAAAHESLLAVARHMLHDRREKARDPASDMTAALLAAHSDDAPIDDERIAGILRLMISAGHNSTTSALGNILLHLAENPGDQALLRDRPDLIPSAIEELMRLHTPVQEMPRTATADTELGHRTIRQGDRLALFFAAGNRDPAAFAEPDRCMLDRSPNRHLAFGIGIHTCLGAAFARSELRIAVEELLRLTSRFEIAGPVEHMRFHRMGVTRLPARLLVQA